MTTKTLSQLAGGTDNREGNTDYAWVVVQLSPRWRVIECRDGIQWIIQHGRLNGGEFRWYSKLHCRSLVGLLLHVGELARREGIEMTPAVRQLLTALPAWIEALRSKASEKAGRRELVIAAA